MAKKQTFQSAAEKKEALDSKKKMLAFKKEGNAYDKILKENIEKIFRPLIEARLGVKIGKAIPLKDKMQTTVELEMDFFYEIVSIEGEPFILHLEFESGNNLEMVYRVGEYHGMALRRKKMPIKHIVIYLGDETPTMRTQLKPDEVYTGFELLDARTIDTNELLSSQVPEVVLMAILGNYKPDQAETILRLVIEKLRKIVKNKRVLKKYFNQLMMLSRLRKIGDLTIKIVQEMPIHFDIETDTLYLRGNEKGLKKGIEQERRKNVINLWQKDIEPAMISNLLNLTIEYVERVIADFQNRNQD
jgi:hypothetical protein